MTAAADPGSPPSGARPDATASSGVDSPAGTWTPRWLCRSVSVPACHPVGMIERLQQPVAICWLPEGTAGFVGLGAAARLRADSFGDLTRMRDRGTELLRAASSACDEPARLAQPRLLGGFAFDGDSPSRTAPWREFGAAQFILPRVLYSFDGQRAWLTLCLTPSDDADDAARGLRLFEATQKVAQNPIPPSPGAALTQARQERLDPSRFGSRAMRLIEAIRSGHAQKIVTAEQVGLRTTAPLGDTETLLALDDSAVESTRFLFRLDGYSMLGATPERLISKRGRQLRTEALAGTISASTARAEQTLLGSQKDRGEHAWVRQAISEALSSLGCEVDHQQPTRVRRLHNLLHLRAPFSAELPGPLHVLDVAQRLHPTPAVGGAPRDRAKQYIVESEGFDRGWYTGAVGWFDALGDGDFDVALRCGVLHDRQAWLYAGAGLVLDSVADREREEISLKLSTLLSALRTRA